MATRTWNLEIKGDGRDAIREADKVERKYKGLGSSVDKTFREKLGSISGHWKDFGSKMASTGRSLAKGMAVGAVGGLAALGLGFKNAFDEAQESIKVTRDTRAVIKSMGGAANVTAGQVGKLAGKLSAKSGVDDELIQSGQNLLLTFGNIRNEVGRGNDIFNQASAVTVDFAARFKKDIPGAAVLVGKALNDPIKGLTALGRVGVQFTEKQKRQIKAMVDAGDTMGAQKIIMRELRHETAGAAAAMATPWDKLKVTLANVSETIGLALMPVVNSIIGWFADKIPQAIDTTKQIWEAIVAGFNNPDLKSGKGIFRIAQELGQRAREAWPHIQRIGEVIADWGRAVGDFFKRNPKVLFAVLAGVIGTLLLGAVVALGAALISAISPLLLVVVAVAAVAGAVTYAYTRWTWFRDAVDTVVAWFQDSALPALQSFATMVVAAFQAFVAWFQSSALPAIRSFIDFAIAKFNQLAAWPGWQKIVTIVTAAVTVIAAIIAAFVVVAIALWNRFGSTILTYVKAVFNAIWTVIQGVFQVIAGVINFWLAVFTGDWSGAWDAIKQIVAGVWQVIQGLIGLALAQIRYVISLAWQAILAVTGIVWHAVLGAVQAVWNAIWGAITAVAGAIAGFITSHWQLILGIFTLGLSTLIGFVVDKWGTIKSTVGDAIGWVKRKIESVLGTISRTWSNIWGGMGDALSGIWDTIKNGVVSGVNLVIGVINTFIRLIKHIPGTGGLHEIGRVGGGGGGGHSVSYTRGPTGPTRATGGMITDGPQYLVGEGNQAYPEAVIATDPRYRRRNLGLLAWAANKLDVPGFAAGGIPGAGVVSGAVHAAAHGLSSLGHGLLNKVRELGARALAPAVAAAKAGIHALPIYDWVKGMATGMVDKIYNGVKGKADEERDRHQAAASAGGGSAAGRRLANDGTLMGRILATIRSLESGGNYRARNPHGSAAGAYQFIGSTWGGYGGYGSAADAPPAVQDAKARGMVQGYLSRYGRVELIPPLWYLGHVPSGREWDRVPGGGNALTPRQYQSRWMATFRRMAQGGIVSYDKGTPALPEDIMGIGPSGQRYQLHKGEPVGARAGGGVNITHGDTNIYVTAPTGLDPAVAGLIRREVRDENAEHDRALRRELRAGPRR